MVFHCQKCNSPIALDKSITKLSKAQIKLLLLKNTKPIPSRNGPVILRDRQELYEISKQNTSKPIITQDFSSYNGSDSSESENSFIYISDTYGKSPPKESSDDTKPAPAEVDTDPQLPDFSKIKTFDLVFRILLQNQDISHPVCSDCSDLLTENYKLKFDQSQREKEYYLTFLKKLKSRGADTQDEAKVAIEFEKCAEEYDKAKSETETKLNELRSQEEHYANLEHELRELQCQYEHLKSNPLREIYEFKNALNLELSSKQSKLDQAKALYLKHLNHLDHLRQLNIYSKIFNILFDGTYGRINGFRLGYKVPWPENNVALGHVVHLLKFVTNRLNIELDHYDIVPMGSKSYIVKNLPSDAANHTKQRPILPLYSSNEFTLGKLFNFNKLDVSMLALLAIVSHIEAKLLEVDQELGLPYAVDVYQGTIGTKSIRVTSNSQWTESCRYLLVNMNWILTFASARQPA